MIDLRRVPLRWRIPRSRAGVPATHPIPVVWNGLRLTLRVAVLTGEPTGSPPLDVSRVLVTVGIGAVKWLNIEIAVVPLAPSKPVANCKSTAAPRDLKRNRRTISLFAPLLAGPASRRPELRTVPKCSSRCPAPVTERKPRPLMVANVGGRHRITPPVSSPDLRARDRGRLSIRCAGRGAQEHEGPTMTCFEVVRANGRNVRCPGPVRWRGLHSSPGGGSYRVFCCDQHVELLDDCLPASVRGMRIGPQRPLKPVTPGPHWAIRTEP